MTDHPATKTAAARAPLGASHLAPEWPRFPPRRLAASSALFAAVLFGAPSRATVRPDPLSPEPGCERWVGKAGGNDPSVEIDLVVCSKGTELEGQLQWSSLQSGWNLRAVAGRWTGGGSTLELRDVKIVKEKPNPGWMFCTIDRYELTRQGADRLEGHYVSTACSDRASVSLKRSSDPSAPLTAQAAPTVAPTPSTAATATASVAPSPPVSPDEDAPDAERSACRCSSVGRSLPLRPFHLPLSAALVVAALSATMFRRRR